MISFIKITVCFVENLFKLFIEGIKRKYGNELESQTREKKWEELER